MQEHVNEGGRSVCLSENVCPAASGFQARCPQIIMHRNASKYDRPAVVLHKPQTDQPAQHTNQPLPMLNRGKAMGRQTCFQQSRYSSHLESLLEERIGWGILDALQQESQAD